MKRDLAQLVFFAAWFAVLYRYRPLRDLIRTAPRSLTVAVGAFLVAWMVVQVRDERARFFPIISMDMYGEYNPLPEMTGVGVHGTRCDGMRGRINLSFMGRSGMRSRLQAMHNGLWYMKSGADSAARWELIEQTLTSIGAMYNRTFPDSLCSIGLDVIRIPPDQYESGRIPAPTLVRDIPLR